MNAVIAQELQVSADSIKEVREWAQVYLVIFHKGLGLSPRFVSKKAIMKPSNITPEMAEAKINNFFYRWDSEGLLSATLWKVRNQTRIYSSVNNTSRHLQKRGYITFKNNQIDYSNVTGFGNHREAIKQIVEG
jgi:hypothetical protein